MNGSERSHDSKLTADEWQRIDAIFQEVVELHGPERSERLRELTGADATLLKEVESLLAFDDVGDEQLPAVRGQTSLPKLQMPTRQVGQLVGPYRLLFPISVNRASEVWCAEDPSADNSDIEERSQTGDPSRVAIKFLRDAVSSTRRLQRFRKEAQFLARFRHPNIAQLIDCDTDETDIPYIVTRYVVGTPLTEFADQKNLNIAQRLSLMIRVCDAVSYAHRHLIVHRDLKPTNILVNTSAEPVILDFGISKSLGEAGDLEQAPTNQAPTNQAGLSASQPVRDIAESKTNSQYLATIESVQLTATHERPMTPAYASPEQALGEPVTTATDQYALGIILYELLSGHHPYSNEAHAWIDDDPNEFPLLERICQRNPLRPSEVTQESASGIQADRDVPQTPRLLAALRGLSPQQLKRRLHGDLDEVVMRAIAKDPTDRYASIADFRIDLDNALHFRPVSARLGDDPFRNAIRRHPMKSLGLSALVSALGCLAFAALWFWNLTSEFSTELNRTTTRAEQAERREEVVTQELQQREGELVESYDVDTQLRTVALGGHMNSAVDASQARRASLAFLARQLAEAGQYESAIAKLGEYRHGLEDSTTNLPTPIRVDLATTHQRLGNPAKGLSFVLPFDKFISSLRGDHQLRRAYTALVVRLLLDAGRDAEAKDIVDDVHYDEFDTIDAQLSLARFRSVIGWKDGARELLGILQQRGRNFELSADQMLELFLLKAEVSDRVESLERLLERSPTGSRQLAARGRVLLGLADNVNSNDLDGKVAAYERTLNNFSELPDHRLAFKAMLQLSQVYEDHDKVAEAKSLREKLWQRIIATHEMETIDAAWCGIGLMQQSASLDERAAVLDRLLKYVEVYSQNDYAVRQLLTHEFQLAMAERDWQRASASLDRLCKLEEQLWGEQSFEHTYALAAQVQTTYLLADSVDGKELAKQRESKARQLVGALLATTEKSPSRTFLQVAELVPNDTGDKEAMHWWIHLFLMHRNNPVDEQREMVKYIHRESLVRSATLGTDAMKILEAGTK